MLINLRQQDEDIAGYTKSFKDLVADIGRLGDEKKQLELYVVGINQSQFKDQIKKIYGSKQWLSYKELGAELHTYSLATKGINDLKKD
jgi:hypothetical protein